MSDNLLYRGVGIRSLVQTVAASISERNGFDDQQGVALRCRTQEGSNDMSKESCPPPTEGTYTPPAHELAEVAEAMQERGMPVIPLLQFAHAAQREHDLAKEANNGS